ncbi:MAG: Holliday junction branch migration DNA helicase RuvB [Solobacterium sp.]|nr:Holliday junction branch migration DNA helicase RuvB [Solobacterium sp.]
MENTSRLLSAEADSSEEAVEATIRPQSLDEYVGQDNLKDNLRIYIKAALQRNESLDHVLLYGPPGLGKTTLAFILANEMHSRIKVASGPSIGKPGDLASILSVLEPGDVLFIDEIHRMPKIVEEVLYPAMEDFELDIMIGGENGGGRSVRLDLPPFTLVGATTRAGDLSAPLRDRFGIISKLEYYDHEQLSSIIRRTSRVLNVPIDEEAVTEIARRSRGTPRIANRLLRRIRDFAQVLNDGVISKEISQTSLDRLQVDSLGLDDVDIRYLKGIIERFHGGPVGLEALANSISEETTTLEDVYEPYLIQIGFVNRTSRGRVVTEKAYEHLKIPHTGSLF